MEIKKLILKFNKFLEEILIFIFLKLIFLLEIWLNLE